MKPRFSATALASGAALALLAGCSGGNGDLNAAAAAADNTNLPQVPAPNNADWTLTVQETAEGGYRMGNPDAPVKLVEYASITCPHCAEFSEEGAEELTNRYVKSGQVSWEYRPFMLFPTDPGIFVLLRCQGPQPFFALTEQLYATQAEWSRREIPPALTQAISAMPAQQQPGQIVKAIGVDQFFRQRGMPQAKLDQCLADPAGLQKLVEIQRHGQNQDNVTGTPTFFINGQKAEGVGFWNNGNAAQSLEPRLIQAIGS